MIKIKNNIKNYKRNQQSKKAVNEVGVGIIAMAVLLLLGSIFFNADFDFSTGNGNHNGNKYHHNESIIFFLNDTTIGRQVKKIDTFPNLELGSFDKYDLIYSANSFFLRANPFTKNYYEFQVPLENPEEIEELLLYFKVNRISGNSDINVYFNDKVIYSGNLKQQEIPLTIPINIKKVKEELLNKKSKEKSTKELSLEQTKEIPTVNVKLKFEIKKPFFFKFI